jgi:hypothetical protein
VKLPFLGQAYTSRSPVVSSQTAINIFPELTEQNSDTIGAFIGTPGLITKYTGSGEVRGLHEAGGFLFGVIGSTVYRWNSSYTATNLGTLPNSTGRVSIIHNETQIAIAHSSGWHWVAISGTAIAPVAGSPSSSILTYQDQYGLYTDTGGLFGITALADLSTLDPLDVADAESQPDNLNSIISNHDEAWLLGNDNTEIWDDTGAALFPFEKISGGVIEQGCCAPFSPAKLDNSVFWLGRDRAGRGIVYRSNGYVPVRISTHPIEFAINGYSTISDAIGFAYQEEGHSFYVLTFPTGDATWVYDVATQGWHQRAWLDSNGLLHRHRANCYATFNGKHIVGDWQNGKVYQMSLDAYLDDTAVIYRERTFDIPDSEQNRVRIDKFELYAAIGDGATPTNGATVQVWLQVSRDAGRTFGFQRIISTGAVGQTNARARWRRLGYGRNIVLRVATTMSNRVHWVDALMVATKLSA